MGESEQTWRGALDLAAEFLGWAPQPDLRDGAGQPWGGTNEARVTA